MQQRGWKTWTARGLGALVALVLLAALGAWLFLRASLPQLEGERQVAGLSGEVKIERDASGVPVISDGVMDVAARPGQPVRRPVRGPERPTGPGVPG